MPRRSNGGARRQRGRTVGAGTAAAMKAAYLALLTARFPDPVTIRLARDEALSFDVVEKVLRQDCAIAAVLKDAGDGQEGTEGALIRVMVGRGEPGHGVLFIAGEGVGVVTRAGLPISIGEPAIHQDLRQLMRDTVGAIARDHGDSGDLEVTVSIPGGEILAARADRGRRGIVGGLSIAGPSSLAPSSSPPWIGSIQRGIDMARAADLNHVAAVTGSAFERAIRGYHRLPGSALIDVGDLVGGALEYLRHHPIPRLTLAGGFGKLARLADGHLDLHASRSAVDLPGLAAILAEHGAAGELVDHARDASSASQVLRLAQQVGLPLADEVAARARRIALDQLDGACAVEVLIFDRQGQLLGRSIGW